MRSAILTLSLAGAISALALQIPQAKVSTSLPPAEKAGVPIKMSVTIELPEGLHAYVPIKDSMMIPVSVSVPKGAKYKLTKVDYPKGEKKTFPGLEEALVYEGKITIPVQVTPPKSTTGDFAFKLDVQVQMCSNEAGTCYPPQTVTVSCKVPIRK